MQIEHVCQTVVSDFDFFFGNWKIIINIFFPNFPRLFLSFQKMECMHKTLVDEYVCKISSRYFRKLLSFAVLNALKDHLYAVYEDVGIFIIIVFVRFGLSKSVLG